MNALLEKVIKLRKGHYCHAVEVFCANDLEEIANTILAENEYEFGQEVVIDFLETLEVYCLDDTNEVEINEFSFTNYIKSL